MKPPKQAKRNETKRSETKRNETKRNEIKRTTPKRNETTEMSQSTVKYFLKKTGYLRREDGSTCFSRPLEL